MITGSVRGERYQKTWKLGKVWIVGISCLSLVSIRTGDRRSNVFHWCAQLFNGQLLKKLAQLPTADVSPLLKAT